MSSVRNRSNNALMTHPLIEAGLNASITVVAVNNDGKRSQPAIEYHLADLMGEFAYNSELE